MAWSTLTWTLLRTTAFVPQGNGRSQPLRQSSGRTEIGCVCALLLHGLVAGCGTTSDPSLPPADAARSPARRSTQDLTGLDAALKQLHLSLSALGASPCSSDEHESVPVLDPDEDDPAALAVVMSQGLATCANYDPVSSCGCANDWTAYARALRTNDEAARTATQAFLWAATLSRRTQGAFESALHDVMRDGTDAERDALLGGPFAYPPDFATWVAERRLAAQAR